MTIIQARKKQAFMITLIGIFMNIFLIILKVLVGIIGRSRALLADGIHSVSDLASDIVVLFGFQFSTRPVDKTHDYGHGKFETFSAGIVGVLLFFAGVGIFISGMRTVIGIFTGGMIEAPSLVALIVAGISILVKELLFRYTIKVGTTVNSQALVANAWHHRSDALSSIATFFGITGAILLGEKWRILDPIAALFVSILIIKTSVEIAIKASKELLETSLSDETELQITQVINKVIGVEELHNLRTRRIGASIAIDVHIRVNKTLTIVQAHRIAEKVEEKLRETFGHETVISVHMEPD
ncbi:cation diffusion facilitator family transporter [Chlamydiota bacterium]